MEIFEISVVSNKVQRNIFQTFFILYFFYTFTLSKSEHNNIRRYGKPKFSDDCQPLEGKNPLFAGNGKRILKEPEP